MEGFPKQPNGTSFSKIEEYADRYFNYGEEVESHNLPPRFAAAVREAIQQRKDQSASKSGFESSKNSQRETLIEAIPDMPIEQVYALIPTKYRNFPPEILEDFWSEAIRVDDETGGKMFRALKKTIMARISNEQHPTPPQATPEIRSESHEITLEKKLSLDKNISRISQQEVFGDSNGSYEGFVAHLTSRGLVSQDAQGMLVWTGGNTRTTFLGDILGDRTPAGEKIYTELMHLRTLARNAGGDISWIAGNHDNMFNAVLFGFTSEMGVSVEKDMNNRLTSYSGNLEPARYLPDIILTEYFNSESIRANIQEILSGNSDTHAVIARRKQVYELGLKNSPAGNPQLDSYRDAIVEQERVLHLFESTYKDTTKSVQEKISAYIALGDSLPKHNLVQLGNMILQNRDSILENIKDSNPAFIEGIYEQNLATIEDDVLYCHTNLTHSMILLIESLISPGEDFKTGVRKLNMFYQNILRWYGSPKPRNPEELPTNHVEYFNAIRNEFISTSSKSRINYSEDTSLPEATKNEITQRLKKYGINAVLHGHTDEDGVPKGTSTLPILSIDRGAYKGSEGVSNRPTAVASVSQDGTLSYY